MTFLRNTRRAYVFIIAIMSKVWGVQRGGTVQANSYYIVNSSTSDARMARSYQSC